MKFLIIATSIILAFLISKYSNRFLSETISKTLVISLIVLTVIINLMPRLTTNAETASHYIKNKYSKPIPILINNENIKNEINNNKFFIVNDVKFFLSNSITYNNENLIIAQYINNKNAEITQISSNSFLFSFPFIAGIENSLRLFTFHVSAAWIAFLGFVLSLIYSIKYLFNKKLSDDNKSFITAKYGFIFCLIATILGMIWAKQSWGAYWNWDPRQISIFLLLSIYLAYFILRQSIPNQEKKARFSAVYSIFAGCSAPFFIFILPRISAGLHPGSSSDGSAPLISSNQSILNDDLFITFAFTLFTFTIAFLYLFHLKIQNQKNRK